MSRDSLKFYKFEGTGNDFVFVEGLVARPKQVEPAFISKICDRHFGIGADGVVFIDKASETDFVWDFYNADGSHAEMCGNAARCVGAYASEVLGKSGEFTLLTEAGVVTIKNRASQQYEVLMSVLLSKKPELKKIKTESGEISGHFINTGVPHFVVQHQQMTNNEMVVLGRALRFHKDFQPSGTNVTFLKKRSEYEIEAVSYERGVENLTLSCGTGAAAAAFVWSETTGINTEIKINLPGGQVSIRQDEKLKRPWLSGPARFVFSGEWKI